MNNPLISIIIPVYNAEKYLRQCLDSVVAQTYTNWECLLIDDGSIDSSGAICDEFEQIDSRFKVVHKYNGGVSSARNRGIEEASGKYIMFFDSDDSVTRNCLETLFVTETPMPDLTIFSFTRVSSEAGCGIKKLKSSMALNHVDVLSLALNMKVDNYMSEAFCFPWNKVFNLSIIKDNRIRYPSDISLREDEIFIYRYLKFCNSIKISPAPLYNYNMGTTGLTYRKRNPEEDISLAKHIIEASIDLEPEGRFLQIQYRRSILYLFSAFANSKDNVLRKMALAQMRDIHNRLLPIDIKDRKLFRVVNSCISFNNVISNLLLTTFASFWASRQKDSLNI